MFGGKTQVFEDITGVRFFETRYSKQESNIELEESF